MPYTLVQLSSPIDTKQSESLATGITHILSEVLGKKEELTAVNIMDNSSNLWFIGNSSLDTHAEQSAYVDIKISAGTNSEAEKQQAIAELYTLLINVLGPIHEISYITLDETPTTDWGYGGKTQQERSIKRTASGDIDTDFYLNKARKERALSLPALLQHFRS